MGSPAAPAGARLIGILPAGADAPAGSGSDRRRQAQPAARRLVLFGEAGHSDYAAAKSAVVHGLLLSLKNEIVRIAPLGRVNAVCPGWTASPMTRTALTDPELVQRVTRTMPLRKVGRPEDVARQVVVLASDELSGHVSGQVVTVAGGMEGRVLHPEGE